MASRYSLRLLWCLFLLNSLSQMMATELVRNLPIQVQINKDTKKTTIIRLENLESSIVLLKKLCAIDGADTASKENRVRREIKKIPLNVLIDLRNFTAQKGFLVSYDSCYQFVNQLIDDQLLHKAKSWLNTLMKQHFFNTSDYQQFERLSVSVGEKILKIIWNDERIKKELYRVAGSSASPVNNRIAYIGKLARGNDLASFLKGVKLVYRNAWYQIIDQEHLVFMKKWEQKKQREHDEKKWFWQRPYWGLWH